MSVVLLELERKLIIIIIYLRKATYFERKSSEIEAAVSEFVYLFIQTNLYVHYKLITYSLITPAICRPPHKMFRSRCHRPTDQIFTKSKNKI